MIGIRDIRMKQMREHIRLLCLLFSFGKADKEEHGFVLYANFGSFDIRHIKGTDYQRRKEDFFWSNRE